MAAARRERLEWLAQPRDSGRRQGPEGRAVIRDLACDQLVLVGVSGQLVVLARQLQRRLDRLAAAAGEEHAVEVAGRERRDSSGELDRRRMRIGPVGEEPELLGLVGAGLRDVRASVADVDAEQRRQPVEVPVAVLVIHVAAFATNDDRHVGLRVRRHARKVQPQVALRLLLERVRICSSCRLSTRHRSPHQRCACLYNRSGHRTSTSIVPHGAPDAPHVYKQG